MTVCAYLDPVRRTSEAVDIDLSARTVSELLGSPTVLSLPRWMDGQRYDVLLDWTRAGAPVSVESEPMSIFGPVVVVPHPRRDLTPQEMAAFRCDLPGGGTVAMDMRRESMMEDQDDRVYRWMRVRAGDGTHPLPMETVPGRAGAQRGAGTGPGQEVG